MDAMTIIKILIYTDTSDISDVNDDESWGVTVLKNLLETRGPAFAKVELRVVNRFQTPETPKRITTQLLDGVDQLWIFGLYQAFADQPFDKAFGGRDNEPDPTELAVLGEWMKKGGVLIAGDHSNPDPINPNGPVDTYLCLGRALGRGVPRAGKLRQWEGPPTTHGDSSVSTIVNTAESTVFNPSAERDSVAQKLLPVIDAQGQPHRLFMGRNAQGEPRLLDVFPDHAHEGLIIIPESPLDGEWPARPDGTKPEPTVIANSCDKRTCDSGPALAAYDGDAAGVGRIVADASWHHYFNVNLRNLKDTVSLPTADLLAQFFSNLAVWLSPLEKRIQMGQEMFDSLFQYPEVREEWGGHPTDIGAAALKHLGNRATPCELLELVQVGLPDKMRDDDSAFNFPPLDAGVRELPPLETVIGSVISTRYAAASKRLRAANLDSPPAPMTDRQIVGEGVLKAFRLHSDGLGRGSAAVTDFLSRHGDGT